jgi:hypothetical protein
MRRWRETEPLAGGARQLEGGVTVATAAGTGAGTAGEADGEAAGAAAARTSALADADGGVEALVGGRGLVLSAESAARRPTPPPWSSPPPLATPPAGRAS